MNGESYCSARSHSLSCAGLSRASTSCRECNKKTWMAGSSGGKTAPRALRPAMTAEKCGSRPSRHAEFLLQAGRRRRVLEHQPLLRKDVVECLLRHQCRLVEAGADQVERARIGVDVADGEDAGNAGLERAGADRDQLVLHLQPPVSDRAELHGEAEERQDRIGVGGGAGG